MKLLHTSGPAIVQGSIRTLLLEDRGRNWSSCVSALAQSTFRRVVAGKHVHPLQFLFSTHAISLSGYSTSCIMDPI